MAKCDPSQDVFADLQWMEGRHQGPGLLRDAARGQFADLIADAAVVALLHLYGTPRIRVAPEVCRACRLPSNSKAALPLPGRFRRCFHPFEKQIFEAFFRGEEFGPRHPTQSPMMPCDCGDEKLPPTTKLLAN